MREQRVMCRQAKLRNAKRFTITYWNQLPTENTAGGKQRGPGSEGKAKSGFESWRDPGWKKRCGENMDAGRDPVLGGDKGAYAP